jgi:predicted dehydrogenase
MNQIRTAIIGFGTSGRVFHAPLIEAEPRFHLDAVVTPAREHAQAVEARYPGTTVIEAVEDLWARAADFDLVVISSPNDTHAVFAQQAVAAGLNVVLEKPVAVTVAEAEAVVAAAAAKGVLLTVFQNRRWDGDFLTLKRVIDSGALGTIHQFESAFEWFQPERSAHFKDSAPSMAGGGIVYDLGPHVIDQAIQLFGDVLDVHAELDGRRPGATNDDDSFVTLHHANGVRSRLWMSAIAPVSRPRFRVVGSRAVFTSYGLDPQEPQLIGGAKPGDPGFGVHADGRTATVGGPDFESSEVLEPGRYLGFYEALADALAGTGPVPVDPADSIRGLQLIQEAVANAR